MVIATDWGSAGAALVAAVIGGIFVLIAARQTFMSAANDAKRQRALDRRAAEEQFRRELLSKATDRLLDVLCTKERELRDALALCRSEVEKGIAVSVDDPALKELVAWT